MSSIEDQQVIEQTRQQIRGLVAEIAQLAKSDVSPLEFYTEFLSRLVSAMQAVGGAVWVTGAEGVGLELQYQINLIDTQLAGSQENQARHGKLLHKVMASGQGSLSPPRSGGSADDEAANPTDFLLIMGPLKNDQTTAGVVEIFQRPNAAPAAQKGYLRFVLQMCELASDFLKTRRLRSFTDQQQIWNQLEGFTRSCHASLDPLATAYTIANEGRRLIDCDRVSVAIMRGSKCQIQAVSGQDLFDKRSNTVALLSRLATAVAATGEPMWYTGDTADMPPQVEEAVQEYVDETHSKTVAVLPLKRPPASSEPETKEKAEVIGALIVEQIENSRLAQGMLQRVDVVTDHSASALSNALEHQNLFLMPVWRAIGKSTWVVKGRTLPKTVAIAAAVVAAFVALAVIPYDFDLKGNGTLKPATLQNVWAPMDGLVQEVPVKHGQLVTKGTKLVEMRNLELEGEYEKVLGDIAATNEQFLSTDRALKDDSTMRADKTGMEITRLRGEREKHLRLLASLKIQKEILDRKRKQLSLDSPIDGQVVTWDVHKELLHRQVKWGQLVVSVADPAENWELEVLMPEDRMGHVTGAQNDASLGENLRVRYIMATDPGREYEGKVVSVHYGAEVRGEEGNTVIIRASLDPQQLVPLREHMQQEFGLPSEAGDEQFKAAVREQLFAGKLTSEKFVELTGLRPGAGVRAKVHCGRAPIGYVWFHDAIAFLQRAWFTVW